MKGKIWLRFFVVFLVCGPFFTTFAHAESFKPIGSRFAGAFDESGRLLAVYDLSYPDFRGKIFLGHIGDPRIDGEVLSAAWDYAKASAVKAPLSIRWAVEMLGDLPKYVLKNSTFPNDWWRNLPWLSHLRSEGQGPGRFALSDFDAQKLHLDLGFASRLEEFGQLLAPGKGKGSIAALSQLVFERAPEGGYKIFWNPSGAPAGDPVSWPRKLIDLRNSHEIMDENIRFEILSDGLIEAAASIAAPALSAAVSTAISQLSRYHDLTFSEHMEMFHEMLSSYSDPVLRMLSAEDREQLVRAFEISSTSIGDWSWVFSPSSDWEEQQRTELDCSARSESWLRAHGLSIWDFNPRFAQATNKRNQKFVYLSAARCPGEDSGPILSIDYSSPWNVARGRIFMEELFIGVDFASYTMSFFGVPVRMLYGWLVQNQLDATQSWEARLIQHLELRSDHGNRETELSILENQRINPMELSRVQRAEIIAERRKLLGI